MLTGLTKAGGVKPVFGVFFWGRLEGGEAKSRSRKGGTGDVAAVGAIAGRGSSQRTRTGEWGHIPVWGGALMLSHVPQAVVKSARLTKAATYRPRSKNE